MAHFSVGLMIGAEKWLLWNTTFSINLVFAYLVWELDLVWSIPPQTILRDNCTNIHNSLIRIIAFVYYASKTSSALSELIVTHISHSFIFRIQMHRRLLAAS